MSRPKLHQVVVGCVVFTLVLLPDFCHGALDDTDDGPPTSATVEQGETENKEAPAERETSDADSPPTSRSKDEAATVTRAPFRSAYEALTHTMSESELERLFRESSFDPMDPAVVDVMNRFPLLGLDNIEAFAKENRMVEIPDVAESPEPHLGKVFHVRGRVKRVRRADLLDEVAEGYDFDHFYLVDLKFDDSLPPLLICARKVPEAWPRDEPIDKLASCYGMLIQANDLQDSARRLVMAAERVAWHPDRPNEKAGVGDDQLLLSKLGMDFGLFDDVRSKNGQPSIESECFHQLLAALSRTSNEELRKHTEKFDLAQLLGDPKRQHGNLIMMDGSARRIQRIDITGDYFKDRLGIDHYYEIDAFIPLKRPVKLSYGKGEPIVYKKNFPVTINVLRLPEGLSESESLNQRIRIPCVYFKLWAYKSQYVSQHNANQYQLSPLLLGIEPEIVETDTAINPYVAAAALGLFAVVLGGLWLALWRTSRKDDQFERSQVERQFQVDKGKSLNTMGIEAEQDPDFSNLD